VKSNRRYSARPGQGAPRWFPENIQEGILTNRVIVYCDHTRAHARRERWSEIVPTYASNVAPAIAKKAAAAERALQDMFPNGYNPTGDDQRSAAHALIEEIRKAQRLVLRCDVCGHTERLPATDLSRVIANRKPSRPDGRRQGEVLGPRCAGSRSG
jgi:hypothetical protein